MEKSCIVIVGLVSLPHIKALGENEEAHFICQLHKLNSGHIVAGSYSVDAHNSELFQLSYDSRTVNGSPK